MFALLNTLKDAMMDGANTAVVYGNAFKGSAYGGGAIDKPSCEYRKDIGGYYNTCLT
jgi:hypothetical protein